MAERAVMLVYFVLLTSSEAGLFRFSINFNQSSSDNLIKKTVKNVLQRIYCSNFAHRLRLSGQRSLCT